MTADVPMLVVASTTVSPLSTPEPIPTDADPDEPSLWECPYYRKQVGLADPGIGDYGEATCSFGCYVEPACVTDGPLPFPRTVAVWREVAWCRGCDSGVTPEEAEDGYHSVPDHHPSCDGMTCDHLCPVEEQCGPAERVVAVTHLVEVTGPSHHADDRLACWLAAPTSEHRACHPDALPDCWHTPTGTVTPIDPIPCDRPAVEVSAPSTLPPTWGVHRPSAWQADDQLAARIREAAR